MVKLLLFIILTIAMFPFSGHLAILVVLSGVLVILFVSKLKSGSITIYQGDFHKNKYFVIFMMSLLAYSIISLLWVQDISGWIYYNVYLFIATVSIVVCNNVLKTKKDFLEIFSYISFMSVIHNIIGWINVLTGEYILSTSPLIPDFREKGNPLSLFNNTNDFATFLVFSIFVTLIVILNTKIKTQRYLLSANVFSSLLLLYLTMSRANYLAFMLGLSIFSLLLMQNRKAIYALILVGGGALMGFIFIPQVFDAINNIIFTKIMNNGDAIRINLLKNGFHFIDQSKGFGVGAGNISYYLQNFSLYDSHNVNSLHNWWMDILVTYGLLFFVLYIIYYVMLLSRLKQLRKSPNRFVRTTAICLISIFSSYLIGSISTSTNFPIIWLWLFFSIAIAFLNIETQSDVLNIKGNEIV